MSANEIAEIKLSCLKLAVAATVINPGEALKLAKEYYNWVMIGR